MPQGKKRARKSRRIISIAAILFIFAGATLALFPFLQDIYYGYFKAPEAVVEPAPEMEEPVVPESPPAPPVEGTVAGSLAIAKLDLNLEVGYGTSEADLKKWPGIYTQSGDPLTGNLSIAGHRNAYGSPFYHLDKMAPGDEISLTYQNTVYLYSVESVFETHSRDWSVIAPTPRPALTLTTCTPLHPINGQYNRLIVRAYLQSTQPLTGN